jgi:hypothetical protein
MIEISETNDKIRSFLNKVKEYEKSDKLDLSSDEDLSIGIMNLISIEEHLFFSGGKTGKTKYYDLLNEVREMRKRLMKMLIKDYEGEGWCIGKHLLAASMRVMEVGTKSLSKGDTAKAHELFKNSYDLFNLFWALNLDLINTGDMQKIASTEKTGVSEKKAESDGNVDLREKEPIAYEEKTFMGRIGKVIGKVLDCCRE